MESRGFAESALWFPFCDGGGGAGEEWVGNIIVESFLRPGKFKFMTKLSEGDDRVCARLGAFRLLGSLRLFVVDDVNVVDAADVLAVFVIVPRRGVEER
jgi:hypothetical protein